PMHPKPLCFFKPTLIFSECGPRHNAACVSYLSHKFTRTLRGKSCPFRRDIAETSFSSMFTKLSRRHSRSIFLEAVSEKPSFSARRKRQAANVHQDLEGKSYAF